MHPRIVIEEVVTHRPAGLHLYFAEKDIEQGRLGGSSEITKLLINNGAHVNATGCDDDTSLHDAAVNSHFEVVRALVEV